MMKIVAIDYYSEGEADVMISDGEFSCRAFAYPSSQHLGDIISTPLIPFDVIGFMRARDREICIKQHEQNRHSYHHDIVGIIVISKKAVMVKVGNIIFDLSDVDIPKDISHGDIVEFTASRIDLK